MSYPTHIVAVGGIVVNKKEEILLVKSFWRGWEFPGGQVETGESLIEALKREILEESNINVNAKKLIGIYSNIKEHVGHDGKTHVPTKVMMDFTCEYIDGEFKPSNETSEGKWVAKNKVLNLIEHPTYAYRYNNYLKGLDYPIYSAYQSRPFVLIDERTI
ncbi:MAG: NUDIX hydrolase [Clostridiales bacterium]|nr:NUDIX hydrolase [Clostridiales bacterium]